MAENLPTGHRVSGIEMARLRRRLIRGTGESPPVMTREKAQSERRGRAYRSTEGCGSVRSSDEASVMEVERRD